MHWRGLEARREGNVKKACLTCGMLNENSALEPLEQ